MLSCPESKLGNPHPLTPPATASAERSSLQRKVPSRDPFLTLDLTRVKTLVNPDTGGTEMAKKLMHALSLPLLVVALWLAGSGGWPWHG